MRNLIKTDLKRIVKDKLFMIALIIAGVFAIITPLMIIGLFEFIGEGDELLNLAYNAKTMYFSAFAPGGDVGLIVPVFIAIILCKDFSYGTVRNKIISGKSRSQIFFSMFISSAIIICGVMLVYALITLGFSLIFLDYQAVAFTFDDLWYLLFSTLLEMIVYICIAALTCFICVFAKNIGLCIVLYIGVVFLFTIVGSVVEVVYMLATPADSGYTFLEFIRNINMFSSTLIGAGDAYTPKNFLYIIISPIAGTGLLTFLGNLIFNKKDLK